MKKLLAINDLTCIFRGDTRADRRSPRAPVRRLIFARRGAAISAGIRIYMRSSFIISASEARRELQKLTITILTITVYESGAERRKIIT